MVHHEYIESEMGGGQHCAKCGNEFADVVHRTLGAIHTPEGFWDKVERPAHYCKHKTTTAQLVVDWELDFYLGNAVKYIERHQLKGDPEGDLRKAKKYLEMKIELLEKGRLESSISHG